MVFDASAVLAHIGSEPGSDIVEEASADACMSAVNFSEVIAKLMERGLTAEQADDIVYRYGFDIIPFDEEMARSTAALRPPTKALGLSLGDRACLALAQLKGLPVLTTDRSWTTVDLGLDVRLAR